MRSRTLFFAALLVLAACGQPQQRETGSDAGSTPYEAVVEDEAPAALPEVDAELLAAPVTGFSAIEPSEVGVFAAPSVMEALEPIIGSEIHEDGASLALTVREEGDNAVADIVRTGLADDSVQAGHLRLEFRHEPDGWYPTNAYRRSRCARGAYANQWTKELCP